MVQPGLNDAGARQRQVYQRLRIARRQRGLWHELEMPTARPHEAPHGPRCADEAYRGTTVANQFIR